MNSELLPSRDRRVYHGLGATPTYRSWYSMISRCTNPKSTSWRFYGAKGISVCQDWLTLAGFIKDMGMRPPGMSIDRINVNGNYEPSNCRWSTDIEQNRNRTGNVLTVDLVKMIRSEVAAGAKQIQLVKKYGINPSTVSRACRSETWDLSRV